MDFDESKKALEKALTSYHSNYPEEMVFRGRMLELLNFPNCFERSLLHAHFTGSAWVVDLKRKKVLLMHHAKLDRWLQLGGHADGDSDMPRVATKELHEESGSTAFELVSEAIFDIDIHTIPQKKDVPEHEHFDVRFLFYGDSQSPLVRNEESLDLAWVSFDKVAEKVDANDSIARMLNKTIKNRH